MSNLTNLLPPEYRQALSRDFLLRLGVVAIALLTILVLAAGALLIPTYAFLQISADAKKERLTNLESSLSSKDEKGLSARLATLAANAAKLANLSSAVSVSTTMSSVLALSRPGITLSTLSYTSAAGDSLATLVVSGSATTREALRKYQLTLQESPLVRSATLPVSAYANDTNIMFSITITLSS